jgi:hypothetical protein
MGKEERSRMGDRKEYQHRGKFPFILTLGGVLDVGRWLDPPCVSWASPARMAGGGVDCRGLRS